jgi:hypothetical protein
MIENLSQHKTLSSNSIPLKNKLIKPWKFNYLLSKGSDTLSIAGGLKK